MKVINTPHIGELVNVTYAVGEILFEAVFSSRGIRMLYPRGPLPVNLEMRANAIPVSFEIHRAGFPAEPMGTHIRQVARYLGMLFNSTKPDLIPQFDLSGLSKTQARVLTNTLKIPFGETRSYFWLTELSGIPKGYRAIGRLLGGNPVPILIPCHRVIRANGEIGGYRLGVDFKKTLLELERKALKRQES